MDENLNVSGAISEIKNANEEDLRQIIEKWYEKTRTDGLRLGAKMICVSVSDIIKKHTKKNAKVSLRDYERMTAEIIKIISVPFKQETKQNDLTEENVDDRATE